LNIGTTQNYSYSVAITGDGSAGSGVGFVISMCEKRPANWSPIGHQASNPASAHQCLLSVLCPTIAIAAERGMPARSRLRMAVRLKL
jgi:hypothetical protein